MRIPGKHLHKYFSRVAFPLAVLREVGDQVLMKVTQEELETLISQGMVFGVGGRSRLRNIRLRAEAAPLDGPTTINSADVPHSVRSISFLDWRAETNFTIQRQQLTCGVVFRHHPKHCEAFASMAAVLRAVREREPLLSASCL